MKRFAIIKKTPFWLLVWWVLIIASWLLFVLNFKLSIEFTWWVETQLDNLIDNEKQLKTDIVSALKQEKFENPQVFVNQKEWKTDILVTAELNNDKATSVIEKTIKTSLLSNKYIESEDNILSLYINWPSISKYMKTTAISAILIWIWFIVVYMFFSFGAIRKIIPPSALISVTIATMVFDVSLTMGWYWLAMMLDSTLQVDSIFIIVLLTVMGYSINDTIIVLDRIRENAKKLTDWLKKWTVLYGNIFEDSLRQTMRRSIWTSVSTLIVVVVMFVFGNDIMQHFAYTMWVGVLFGTYSSLFIAAPAIYLLTWKYNKERKKLK